MSRRQDEPAEGTYEKWIADLIGAESDEDLAALYEAGDSEPDINDTLPAFDCYDEDSRP